MAESPSLPPSASQGSLTVALAIDLPEEHAALIEQLEPRVHLIRTPARPSRWPSDWEGEPSFTRSEDEEREYREALASADAIMGVPDGGPEALATVVRANPNLRWLSTMAAGGGAQVKAAGLSDDELERVTFTTSAGAHGGPLAEFAIFGILAGAKQLRRLERQQREHVWPKARQRPQHLEEMTVLIAGLGGIGSATAARLKAFGATVWGTSRSATPVDNVDRIVPLHELHDVLGEVDAIAITLPGTDETAHLFDARAFAAMKDGVILTNVGRGTVIDETALLDALNSGKVAFAALDVFAHEPLDPTSPLWDHENVLVSPHDAALTDREGERIARLFADNATALLDGTPMRNVVNTHSFY